MRRLEIIITRLLWFVPTLVGLVVIVFAISHIIPTDPVRVLAGENATPEQIEALRIKFGYDKPLYIQLLSYFLDLLRGNMGNSLYSQRPIVEDLFSRLPATLELTLMAVFIAVLVGIPVGVVSALKRNTTFDHV